MTTITHIYGERERAIQINGLYASTQVVFTRTNMYILLFLPDIDPMTPLRETPHLSSNISPFFYFRLIKPAAATANPLTFLYSKTPCPTEPVLNMFLIMHVNSLVSIVHIDKSHKSITQCFISHISCDVNTISCNFNI